MTIAAAYRHLVTAAAMPSASRTRRRPRRNDDRLHAEPAATITLTKYVAYHSSSQVPEPPGDVDRGARRSLPKHARCRRGVPAGSSRSPNSTPGSTGSGHAPTSPSTATTRPSRRSAGTCSRSRRPRRRRRTRYRRQGAHRRRLRRPLLLGHRDLHGPVPRVHATRSAPRPAALPPPHAADRARERATELIQRGALFPWRTINGDEASAYYPPAPPSTTSTRTSPTPSSATSMLRGDTDVPRRRGAEILVETARLWEDLGFYGNGDHAEFHIHGVTGPDEYTDGRQRQPLHERDGAVQPALRGRRSRELQAERPRPTRPRAPSSTCDRPSRRVGSRRRRPCTCPTTSERGIHPQDDAFLDREVWDLEHTPAGEVPAAAALPPAGDLPLPGDQAGRHRAGDVPAR